MEKGCRARLQHRLARGGSPAEPLPCGQAPSLTRTQRLPRPAAPYPAENAPRSPQPSRYRAPPRGDAPFLLCPAGRAAVPPLRRSPLAAAARRWLMAGPLPAALGPGAAPPREAFPGKCFPSRAPPPRGDKSDREAPPIFCASANRSEVRARSLPPSGHRGRGGTSRSAEANQRSGGENEAVPAPSPAGLSGRAQRTRMGCPH